LLGQKPPGTPRNAASGPGPPSPRRGWYVFESPGSANRRNNGSFHSLILLGLPAINITGFPSCGSLSYSSLYINAPVGGGRFLDQHLHSLSPSLSCRQCNLLSHALWRRFCATGGNRPTASSPTIGMVWRLAMAGRRLAGTRARPGQSPYIGHTLLLAADAAYR
jgi:hypothetical protein